MSDSEHEQMPVDALFVGAGPANLAGAIRLAQLVKQHNAQVAASERTGRPFGEEFTIGVIEKGPYLGAHSFSGAVMNPRGLDELLPGWRAEAPIESEVTEEEVLFLTDDGKAKSAFPFGMIPPPLRNHDNVIVSLNKLVKWLGGKAEEMGVMVFPEFPGRHLLYREDGRSVRGVRTGDKGVGKDGERKARFEPGTDLLARVTVLGEGVRGSLAKELIAKLGLEGDNPQTYATGVKELWEVPAGRATKGKVAHTTGFPNSDKEYGGSFIYHLSDTQIAVGMVVALDVADPRLDPHLKLQQLKTHPYVKSLLEGGRMIAYGAKALPEGGYMAFPKLTADGVLLVGDTASFLNAQNLKGIHYAIKSGICAAETIYEALAAELSRDATAAPAEPSLLSSAELAGYARRIALSYIHEDLYAARNFRQSFKDGFKKGKVRAGLRYAFGQGKPIHTEPDFSHMQKTAEAGLPKPAMVFDGKLTFDKLSDVYLSGTKHDEDQPCHLVIADYDICNNRCTKEYGNPCQHFCPASVYEMVPNDAANAAGGIHLQVTFANCVHCKTCDIRDPYELITWVTPAGGGGPVYTGL